MTPPLTHLLTLLWEFQMGTQRGTHDSELIAPSTSRFEPSRGGSGPLLLHSRCSSTARLYLVKKSTSYNGRAHRRSKLRIQVSPHSVGRPDSSVNCNNGSGACGLHGLPIERIPAGSGASSQLNATGGCRYSPYRWTGGITNGRHGGEGSLIMC